MLFYLLFAAAPDGAPGQRDFYVPDATPYPGAFKAENGLWVIELEELGDLMRLGQECGVVRLINPDGILELLVDHPHL